MLGPVRATVFVLALLGIFALVVAADEPYPTRPVTLVGNKDELAAGIGVLGRRGWARITGLVLASLGLAGKLIGLILVLVGAGTTRRELLQNGVVVDPVPSLIFGAIIFVSFGAAYFFVLITLARRGRVFV